MVQRWRVRQLLRFLSQKIRAPCGPASVGPMHFGTSSRPPQQPCLSMSEHGVDARCLGIERWRRVSCEPNPTSSVRTSAPSLRREPFWDARCFTAATSEEGRRGVCLVCLATSWCLSGAVRLSRGDGNRCSPAERDLESADLAIGRVCSCEHPLTRPQPAGAW